MKSRLRQILLSSDSEGVNIFFHREPALCRAGFYSFLGKGASLSIEAYGGEAAGAKCCADFLTFFLSVPTLICGTGAMKFFSLLTVPAMACPAEQLDGHKMLTGSKPSQKNLLTSAGSSLIRWLHVEVLKEYAACYGQCRQFSC